MATVNSRKIVDEIIAGGGFYLDDPPVDRIVQYTNAWGGITYGLIYHGEPLDKYSYVQNPEIIFERKRDYLREEAMTARMSTADEIRQRSLPILVDYYDMGKTSGLLYMTARVQVEIAAQLAEINETLKQIRDQLSQQKG